NAPAVVGTLKPTTSQAESVTGVRRTNPSNRISTVPLVSGAEPPCQFNPVLQLSSSPRPSHLTGADTGTSSPVASRAAPAENPLNWITFKNAAFGAKVITIRSSVPPLPTVPVQLLIVRVPLPVSEPAAKVRRA